MNITTYYIRSVHTHDRRRDANLTTTSRIDALSFGLHWAGIENADRVAELVDANNGRFCLTIGDDALYCNTSKSIPNKE